MIDYRDAPMLSSFRAVIDHIKDNSTSVLESEEADATKTDVAIWEQGDDAFTTPAMGTHFLAIVLNGTAWADVDFAACTGPRQARIAPGSLGYIPAGNSCAASFDGRFRSAHIMLSAQIFDEELEDLTQDRPATRQCGGFISESIPAISTAALALISCAKARRGPDLTRSSLEHALARRIAKAAHPSAGGDRRRSALSAVQTKQVIDYIEDRISENFELADAAAFVSTTVPVLLRSFRDETGMSPSAFQTERRVDRVRAWLVQTEDAAPLELARKAGFATLKEMDIAFRNVLGVGFESYRRGALS
ncbi:MAG: AraC family transcriptional regulator [Pseudomonadota bacterium]